jgi:hypothetical protein
LSSPPTGLPGEDRDLGFIHLCIPSCLIVLGMWMALTKIAEQINDNPVFFKKELFC